MKEGIQHPVAPLETTVGKVLDALQDRVSVRLALCEDAEHERCGCRGHEVFADAHDRSYT